MSLVQLEETGYLSAITALSLSLNYQKKELEKRAEINPP